MSGGSQAAWPDFVPGGAPSANGGTPGGGEALRRAKTAPYIQPLGTVPAAAPKNGSHDAGGNGANGGGSNGARGPAEPQPFSADLRNALRTRAERIPLRALERRGYRNVQVLDMATIEKIVVDATAHTLQRHMAVLTHEEREKLEVDARREFAKLLAEHKRVVAEKSDVERAREELERQVAGLRAEVQRQTGNLKTERDRSFAAATFSLSPDSFREMEEKIRKLFGQLVASERRTSLAEAGPKALHGLNELEREVASFLDRLLDAERDRYLGSVRKDHTEKVDVLEKRIAKLNKALATTEDALRRVSEMKAGDPGIASIYDSVQGLSAEDAFFTRKKELLELIFKDNLLIQKISLDGAAGGGSAPATVAFPSTSELKLDFEPPLEPLADETAY